MANINLNEHIKKSEIKKQAIADKLEISRQSLDTWLANPDNEQYAKIVSAINEIARTQYINTTGDNNQVRDNVFNEGTITYNSSNDELKMLIADLTIENKKLKEELQKCKKQ